jgi:hypothetical protein
LVGECGAGRCGMFRLKFDNFENYAVGDYSADFFFATFHTDFYRFTKTFEQKK